MYWCPEVYIYTQKSTRIWKVYLNYSKCTWKFSILLYKHHAKWSLVQPDTRLSPPLRRQSSFSSAASHQCLWDIAAAWLALIFSRHNRFAETHSHLQLSFHITDRLLAAGNKKQLQFTLSCSDMSILVLGCLGAAHHFNIYILLNL